MAHENSVGGALSFEKQKVFDQDVADLKNAERLHGMEGVLEGRVKFGLDPAGMMVVRDTAPLARRVIEILGTTEEDVWPLVKELHSRGPWSSAERLSTAKDPQIKAYIVMAAATHESGWPGYAPEAYLADRQRVIDELRAFRTDQFEACKHTLESQIADLEDQTIKIGDKEVRVAMASNDAALGLAVKGYEGCVIRAKDMRFAQTDKISDALLVQEGFVRGFGEKYDAAKDGFIRVAPETPGARIVWVKQQESGQPIESMKPAVKRITPGYVLTYGNEALALDLVRKAIVMQRGLPKE